MASAREYSNWSSLSLQLYLLKASELKTLNYELYLYNCIYICSYIYKLASKEVAPGVCGLSLLCSRHFCLPWILRFYSTIAPFATIFLWWGGNNSWKQPSPVKPTPIILPDTLSDYLFSFLISKLFFLLRCCQCSSHCRRAHPGIFPKQMWAGAAIKHALHILLEQADICLAI